MIIYDLSIFPLHIFCLKISHINIPILSYNTYISEILFILSDYI